MRTSLPSSPGVYAIVHITTGRSYIGSSKNLAHRWAQHRSDLARNRHTNPKLQHSWNKHGESEFNFVVLEICDLDDRITREQYYIDTKKPYYNIAPLAGTPTDTKFSDETKAIISVSQKEIWSRPGYRERMSMKQKGTWDDDRRAEAAERIRKQRPFTEGKRLETIKTPEHREKMSKIRKKTHSKESFKENWRRGRGVEPFKVISPEGEVFEVINATDFARQHGLNSGNLLSVKRGARPHNKGWRLYHESD